MVSSALGTIEAGELREAKRRQHGGGGGVEAGGSFGELALLYFAPRAATLTATANAVVWVTARQQFKELLMKARTLRRIQHAAPLSIH